MVLEHGGHHGSVVELSDSGAVMSVGAARVKVPFGSDVRVDGALVRLEAPLDASDAADIRSGSEEALRRWRAEAAKRAEVPAYVVLNDKELVGIAERRPTTLAELAKCKGMGEIRLERWGDELLAVLAGVQSEVRSQ
jgi:superfamily II DNA helicase RecQ